MNNVNKYGIMFLRFKEPYTMKDSAKFIKDAGFNNVMLWWYDGFLQAGFETTNYQYSTKEEQLKIIRDQNLNVCYLHAHSDILCNELWIEGPNGEKLVKEMKKVVLDCAGINVPIMVMHITSGNNSPTQNAIGLRRINEIVKYAETCGVTIAIENTKSTKHIDFVLENIASRNIGLCYDSGHDFLYSDNPYSIIHRHKDRLIALHLHDNEGGIPKNFPDRYPDSHAIPGEGNINWKQIKNALNEIGYKGVILLEIESNTIGDRESPKDFLERAYEACNKLG
jgi:sugar phosphate isomerase/epimerase